MSQDSIYALLPAPGHHASKTFRWVDDESIELVRTYDAGWQFKFYEFDGLSSIEDLADAVDLVATGGPERGAFMIRGRPRDHVGDGQLVNRRLNAKQDRPNRPCWERHPEGRRWMMIDIDDLPAPDGVSNEPTPAELVQAVEATTGHLPPCFRDATTFYQWSSSAGLVSEGGTYRTGWENLRLHLWYWCDRRVCSDSVREWLKAYHEDHDAPIDWRVFNPVHPHFVAHPRFLDGPDPAPERSGLLCGWEDEVTLPECVLGGTTYDEKQREIEQQRREQRQKARERPSVLSAAQMEQREQQYAAAALEKACETIATTPAGYRETTLRDEAYSIGGLVGAGALPAGQARTALIQAGLDAGLPRDEAEDKATRALEAGMESPRDLTDIRHPTSPDGGTSGDPDPTTLDDVPDVDAIRSHFASDDYTAPTITKHDTDGAVLDALMRRTPIEQFIQLVERIRSDAPEHLPDHCRFSHAPRVRAR